MLNNIEIRYKSKQDKIKIQLIKDLENINTNTKLLSFLLEDYFLKKDKITEYKMKLLQEKIKNP
jgi:hypothetical protein